MKNIIVFLLLFSVTTGQNGFYKLLLQDNYDQQITSHLRINNQLFLSLPVVYDADTSGNKGYRDTYIIKLDTATLNVISYFSLKSVSKTLKSIYIDKLFPLIHPITKETVIGFLGKCIKQDTTDTTTYVYCGWLKDDFSEVKFSTLLPDSIVYTGYGNVFYYAVADVQDALNLTDSTFLFVASFYKYPAPEYDFVAQIKFDTSGFYLVDSVHLPTSRMYYRLYNSANGIKLVSTSQNNRLYVRTLTLSPLTVATTQFIFMPSGYAPPPSGQFYLGFDGIDNNDTLIANVIYNSRYQYFYTLDLVNPAVIDSVLIGEDSSGYSEVSHMNNSIVKQKNYLFFVGGEFSLRGIDAWERWDYTWLAGTPSSWLTNIIVTVFDLDSNKVNNRIILGGDAIYDVRGIVSLDSASVILYGWRFPWGVPGRTDGDAFVWKISNGIVTSTLGASPENVATIFPNPTSNIVKITTTKSYSPTIELYSLEGKLVFRKSYGNANNFEIDISNLPDGVYLLRFVADGFVFEEKVVKE